MCPAWDASQAPPRRTRICPTCQSYEFSLGDVPSRSQMAGCDADRLTGRWGGRRLRPTPPSRGGRPSLELPSLHVNAPCRFPPCGWGARSCLVGGLVPPSHRYSGRRLCRRVTPPARRAGSRPPIMHPDTQSQVPRSGACCVDSAGRPPGSATRRTSPRGWDPGVRLRPRTAAPRWRSPCSRARRSARSQDPPLIAAPSRRPRCPDVDRR